MIDKIKDTLGFCAHTPFWSDAAAIGFFVLGTTLGLVLGMSLTHLLR